MSAPRLSNGLIAAIDSSGGGTPLSALVNAFGNAALAQVNMNTIGVTASGGFASAWADARGAGFGSAWTFTGTAQPSYVQNANGVWVLRLDGVNDQSTNNTGLQAVLQNVGAGFVYAVFTSGAGTGTAVYFSRGTSQTITRLSIQSNAPSAGMTGKAETLDETAGTTTINAGTVDGTLRDALAVADFTGGMLHLYEAGIETAGSPHALHDAGSTSNTASLSVRLGVRGSTNDFLAGDLSAVVVGTVMPTASQRAALHAFGVAAGAAA